MPSPKQNLEIETKPKMDKRGLRLKFRKKISSILTWIRIGQIRLYIDIHGWNKDTETKRRNEESQAEVRENKR